VSNYEKLLFLLAVSSNRAFTPTFGGNPATLDFPVTCVEFSFCLNRMVIQYYDVVDVIGGSGPAFLLLLLLAAGRRHLQARAPLDLVCQPNLVLVRRSNHKKQASEERITTNRMNRRDQWNNVVYEEEGSLGAVAIAFDISLRIWYIDDSKLRMRGQVALQHNASTGAFRMSYYGVQVAFATGDELATITSSLVLPNPTEWLLPKASKVSGKHTKGRVLLMGFTSGACEKLQLV
jgi:hypothetical protein